MAKKKSFLRGIPVKPFCEGSSKTSLCQVVPRSNNPLLAGRCPNFEGNSPYKLPEKNSKTHKSAQTQSFGPSVGGLLYQDYFLVVLQGELPTTLSCPIFGKSCPPKFLASDQVGASRSPKEPISQTSYNMRSEGLRTQFQDLEQLSVQFRNR